MIGISGKRGVCKALEWVRMGKASGVGFKRGWCCLGVRKCFELGAVLAELLVFGFVVVGDRISKGGRGDMWSDGRTRPRNKMRDGVWLGCGIRVRVRGRVRVGVRVRDRVGVRVKDRLKVR
jgi:hypothetical protein